jgi:hypothetical protein
MALDPQEEKRISDLETRIRDIEDTFGNIRFPSFWRFMQPLVADILRLPNLSADPATATAGELAVVGGKLKIYDGAAWTTVGTQT